MDGVGSEWTKKAAEVSAIHRVLRRLRFVDPRAPGPTCILFVSSRDYSSPAYRASCSRTVSRKSRDASDQERRF